MAAKSAGTSLAHQATVPENRLQSRHPYKKFYR